MPSLTNGWMADGVLRPFKPILDPTPKDMQKPLCCRYHRYMGHGTRNCRAVRGTFHKKILDGTLNVIREQEVQQNPLPQHHRGKATAVVLFHNGAMRMKWLVVQVCLQQLSLLFKKALPFRLCSINWGSKRCQRG
nr:hypothetical protein CFP56_67870 [Quercus suber]